MSVWAVLSGFTGKRPVVCVSPATGQGSPWLPRSTSNDWRGINDSAVKPETVVLPVSDLGKT